MSLDLPESVKYETRGGTCYITINRPESMNAMNQEVLRALPLAIQELESDKSLYVGVITGAGGRAFSAGGDLKEMAGFIGTDDNPMIHSTARTGVQAGNARKPLIAAIDGYAFAGGFELALGCDIRIATRKSQFAIPEVKRSIIAGPGLTHLPRMIPLGEALLMAMTGDPISAERAYQIALIQGLAEDRDELFEKVDKIAATIANNPPLAVQDVKHIVKVGVNIPVEYAVKFRDKFSDVILQTEDAKEGATAFAEKRAPVWKMR